MRYKNKNTSIAKPPTITLLIQYKYQSHQSSGPHTQYTSQIKIVLVKIFGIGKINCLNLSVESP